MAFDFQINKDIVWNIDKELLAKAEANKPVIKKTKVKPKRIVDVMKNDQTEIVASSYSIDDLKNVLLGKNDSLIIDLGDHQVGTFSISINSVGSPMDAPLFLRVKFAEIPDELTAKSSDYEGWLSKSWIQEEFIHIDVLPTRLSLPRRYSCRYIELTVIDTSPKWKASFDNPVFIAESSVDKGSLREKIIEDPLLKKIYDVSIKTLEDCMQDVFEDGPKRDRRLWIGDLRLQASANYSSFQANDLVKRCLYLFGGMTTQDGKIPANVFTVPSLIPDDTFLFDYSLFFVTILEEYVRMTDDIDVLIDLYPVAKKQIDLALTKVDKEGRLILDESWPVFIDWSDDFDKTTAGQGVLIYSLRRFCKLSEKMEDKQRNEYEASLAVIESFARNMLFDKETNQFIIEKTKERNAASQVWMVLAEVFDAQKNKQVMETMIKEHFPIKDFGTPYMYHHVVEALFSTGLDEEACMLIKDYWGGMIALGADTFWEAFKPDDPSFSPYGSPIISSYCHAWSCTPAYLLDKYLLEEYKI